MVVRTVMHQWVGSGGDASGLGSMPEGLDVLTVSSREAEAALGVVSASLRLLALLEWLEIVWTMPFFSSSKSCMWWPYCRRVRAKERMSFKWKQTHDTSLFKSLWHLANSPQTAHDDMMKMTMMVMMTMTMTSIANTMTVTTTTQWPQQITITHMSRKVSPCICVRRDEWGCRSEPRHTQ